MKNKILTGIICMLIGAIISTLGWYLYIKSTMNINPQMNEFRQMDNMNQNMQGRPEMPEGMENGQMPPEKPVNE